MAQMVDIIARSNKNIDVILSTNQSIGVKGGFIAEEFHAETFNLDATLKGEQARAYTDRSDGWSQLDWNGSRLQKNDVPDIVIARDGEVVGTSQSKYYDTAETTAAQMSTVKDGKIKYADMDSLLGPEDQVNPVYKTAPGETEPVPTTTIKEHAQARADALSSRNADHNQVEACRNTASKATDRIKAGKAGSTSLTKSDANTLGAGDKSRLKSVENAYQTCSTIRQMGNAACGAAAMSAIICGTVNTLQYIKQVSDNKIAPREATFHIIGETVAAAAHSALKAAANAGVQSLIVRYGTQQSAMQLLAQQGLKSICRNNIVTVGVVCTIEGIKDLVKLGSGKITSQEFFDRQGKGLLSTATGVLGSNLGAAGAGALAASMGFAGTAAAMALAITGGLAGGIIAGLALTLAIQNGIEKPYRDLVCNTSLCQEAGSELARLSRSIFRGQLIFEKFLEADYLLDRQLENQMARIDAAGQRVRDAINRI